MVKDLILGTAGHIDHGKTSLIRALTGVDTDRLPEEKRRGITIELGFAELVIDDFRLGIVDVPGHERFVRQMLAGATGMDVALLVVAADDSVKPQTLEHLEVLKCMDLTAGVIALTKCDIADPDWLELVVAEVREVVQGTFLEDAPIVRTSAARGEGLDTLRAALHDAAVKAYAQLPAEVWQAPFRMAIDRAFTIVGHGTVVTGSVASGQVTVGDQLVIEPGHVEVRVRGLRNHDRPVESVHRGQRAAVNLAGVRHDEIVRGHELASPGHLQPGRLITAQLQLLKSFPRPLKNRARVRLHVGTAEILASVRLLDQDRLEPGQSGWAQLFLSEPAATIWKQPLVIRSESPVLTMGGGRILVPTATRIRRLTAEQRGHLAALSGDDVAARASAALYFAPAGPWEPADLVRTAGVHDVDAVATSLRKSGDLLELRASPRRTLTIHREVYRAWSERIVRQMERFYAENKLRLWIDLSAVASCFPRLADELFLPAVLQRMHHDGVVNLRGQKVALASHQPQLSAAESALLDELVAGFATAKFQPPTVSELQKSHPKFEKRIKALIDLAVSEETLVHIAGDMFLHAAALADMKDTLRQAMAAGQGLSVSEIREILGTSRKYAVPFCEFLDKNGFTRRQGDLRYWKA